MGKGKFTYSVVMFIVKVRLVEKSVKSHVGSVIDTNVISQKIILGSKRMRADIKRKSKPSHDDFSGDRSITSLTASFVACAMATATELLLAMTSGIPD